MQIDTILKLVESLGLPIQSQKAFFKIEAPPHVMHIEMPRKSGRVGRVDLKGFDDLKHPALREVTPAEARRQHLGKVSRQIDFSKDEGAVLSALRLCLAQMKPAKATSEPTGAMRDSTMAISMRLPAGLLAAIEIERERIQEQSLPGIEISQTTAIRVLLHEAIDARLKTRPGE
jgi:hypothetical protein